MKYKDLLPILRAGFELPSAQSTVREVPMFAAPRLAVAFFLVLLVFNPIPAQESSGQNVQRSAPIVTATASAERVRFTAPSNVVRMQLQVISETGQILFDVSNKGNVLDWSLQDSTGRRLQGSYLTVVTVKSLSGRLSERIGTVSVEEKQVELKAVGATGLMAAQQQAVGPIEENVALTILQAGETEAATIVAHDGTQGEINRSRGALSFRLGDFFSGQDTEQMRLTEEGNLGIGTDSPQAKLDVAGVIRTSKGIEFANGTDGTKVTKLTTTATGSLQQTLADGSVVANVTGTGTQNQIAKWTANPGELGDGAVYENGGLVVIGQNSSGQLAPLAAVSGQYHTLEVGVPPGGKSPLTLAGGSGVMEFWKDLGGGVGNPAAAVSFGMAVPGTPATNDMLFSSEMPGIGWNERMRLTNAGSLGIGTIAPIQKLEVAGNVKVSGAGNGLILDDGTTLTTVAGLRRESNPFSPNVVDGFSGNSVAAPFVGATIGGGGESGSPNQVTQFWGTVGGGKGNTSSGPVATVGGGIGNTASGVAATIGGGQNNTASGVSATVGGGGSFNIASGDWSTVPGGFFNTAAGNYSFAAGRRAKANDAGAFVWADTTEADFTSTAANQFLIRASGGVGIGTTAPQAKLDIQGGADSDGSFDPKAIALSYRGGGFRHWIRTRHNGSTSVGNGIDFYLNSSGSAGGSTGPGAGSSLVMSLDAANVGIGTTGAFGFGLSHSLFLANDFGDIHNSLRIDGNANNLYLVARSEPGAAAGAGIIFRTGPGIQEENDRVSIDPNGNVGIGTNTPASKLHIIAPASPNPISAMTIDVQSFNTGSNALASHFFRVRDVGSGSASAFLIRGDGNVGIGTESPSATLEVKVGGTTLADAWTTRSSERFKSNIQTIPFALNKVLQLRGVTFDYKETQKHSIGFIAEEVGRVLPEVVEYEANGRDAQGLDYNRLTPVVVEAIKEQQQEIQDQQLTVKQQQAQLERQQEEIKQQSEQNARQQTKLTQQQQQIESLKKLICLDHPRAELCKQ